MVLRRELLARPEKEPKTALGARLRSVRREAGYADRNAFAEVLEIAINTLASYERGDTAPDADVLARYRDRCGIDVNWLVSGDGEMFADPSKAREKPDSFVPDLVRKLGRIADRLHREAGIKLQPEDVSAEAAKLYNELLRRVGDMTDADEVQAVFPQLEVLLKKRLAEAVAEPGTGKRSA